HDRLRASPVDLTPNIDIKAVTLERGFYKRANRFCGSSARSPHHLIRRAQVVVGPLQDGGGNDNVGIRKHGGNSPPPSSNGSTSRMPTESWDYLANALMNCDFGRLSVSDDVDHIFNRQEKRITFVKKTRFISCAFSS